MQGTRTRTGIIIVSVLVAAGCGKSPPPAAPQQETAPAATQSAPRSAPANSTAQADSPALPAIEAYVDPKTGELREATREEAAAAAQDKSATTSTNAKPPQKPIQLPDGTVVDILDDGASHRLQGCVKGDGSTAIDAGCDKSNGAKP
jgi:hypothetical protein